MTRHLPPHLAALTAPGFFGRDVGVAEVIQTHISWVVLAGQDVYKLKKPVDLGFLDFRTLEQRRIAGEREVTLNRRLCPALYRGVVPVRRTTTGYTLGAGPGEIVDYAVHLARLPADRMLDRRLAAGRVGPAEIAAIGRRLADFHAGAETSPEITALGGPATVLANWQENLAQIAPFRGRTIDPEQWETCRAWLAAIWPETDTRLADRATRGRVRDGHGDARAENICLVGDEPWIYDCIEFNDRFRYADVAADLAFLAMDLDWWDRPDLARVYVDAYVESSGDADLRRILPFFQCYRAVVRGKVESIRLDESGFSEADLAASADRARRYFALGVRYARGGRPPWLIIVRGLSGTGKSTLAAAIGRHLGWPVLSTDRIRKELAGLPAIAGAASPVDQGIYRPEMTRATYQVLLERAAAALGRGESVIADGTFLDVDRRAEARRVAWRRAARILMVETRAPPETVRTRLVERARAGGSGSDADWLVYQAQRDRVPVAPADESIADLTIDSSRPLADQVAAVLDRTDPVSGR